MIAMAIGMKKKDWNTRFSWVSFVKYCKIHWKRSAFVYTIWCLTWLLQEIRTSVAATIKKWRNTDLMLPILWRASLKNTNPVSMINIKNDISHSSKPCFKTPARIFALPPKQHIKHPKRKWLQLAAQLKIAIKCIKNRIKSKEKMNFLKSCFQM